MIVVVILVIRAQALQETSITTIQIGITISQGLGPSFQIDLLKTGRIACRAKIHS